MARTTSGPSGRLWRMNEERELLLKAVEATRKANKRLLATGVVVVLIGAALLVLFDPWANDTGSLGEFSRRVWAQMLAGIVAGIGVSLIAVSFGRFDESGNRKTWYVVVTAIPLIGDLVRWVVRRQGKELVNAPSQSSDDDPFIRA